MNSLRSSERNRDFTIFMSFVKLHQKPRKKRKPCRCACVVQTADSSTCLSQAPCLLFFALAPPFVFVFVGGGGGVSFALFLTFNFNISRVSLLTPPNRRSGESSGGTPRGFGHTRCEKILDTPLNRREICKRHVCR